MRADLSDHKNDTITGTEKLIYDHISSSPGISAVTLAKDIGKSIITIKRFLKTLVDLNKIEYRGAKNFSL